MIKILTPAIFILFLIFSNSNAQCFSRNGIMNESCKSLTIITPPAFELSLGLSNKHLIKGEINYITKNEIVYGGSLGIRPGNYRVTNINQEDASLHAFVGYNLAGCIIMGVTAGITHYTKNSSINDMLVNSSEFKKQIGMSLKVISNYTSFPITFGFYGSNAEIGFTVGTIF